MGTNQLVFFYFVPEVFSFILVLISRYLFRTLWHFPEAMMFTNAGKFILRNLGFSSMGERAEGQGAWQCHPSRSCQMLGTLPSVDKEHD